MALTIARKLQEQVRSPLTYGSPQPHTSPSFLVSGYALLQPAPQARLSRLWRDEEDEVRGLAVEKARRPVRAKSALGVGICMVRCVFLWLIC